MLTLFAAASTAATSSFGGELLMIVLTALITTLITGTASMLGFWFLYAKNLVSREEVEKLIKDHSPYLQDKHLIFNRLDSKDKTLDDMARTIHEIFSLVQDMRVKLESLSVQINMKDR